MLIWATKLRQGWRRLEQHITHWQDALGVTASPMSERPGGAAKKVLPRGEELAAKANRLPTNVAGGCRFG